MDRLATLQAFLRDDPADPFTRFALASEHVKRGQTVEGLAMYEELMRDRPDYVGTYYHLGNLYAEVGRPEDAASTYRAGIRAAGAAGDVHAASELRAALMDLQYSEEDA